MGDGMVEQTVDDERSVQTVVNALGRKPRICDSRIWLGIADPKNCTTVSFVNTSDRQTADEEVSEPQACKLRGTDAAVGLHGSGDGPGGA